MIKEIEKRIYNAWLANYMSSQGKPFQLRKKWDNFEENDSYIYVQKIARLVERHHINIDMFFKAPFQLYPGEYFPLKYFSKLKAIKLYFKYKTKLEDGQIDSEDNIEFVKASLIRIGKVCKERKIHFNKYFFLKTGLIYSWMSEYSEGHISIYVIVSKIDVIRKQISKLENDHKELLFGEDFEAKLYTQNYKYKNSKKVKSMLEKAEKTINNIVDSL